MKKLIAFTVVLFMSAQAYASDVWSTLSQANRNARIVAQAQTTVPPHLPQLAGQCKPFAVDVVRVASNQANGYVWDGITTPPGDIYTRTLPLTADYSYSGDMANYYWVSSSYVVATSGNGTSTLSSAVAGSIIQMRVALAGGGYSPHTAIVEVNNTSTQMITLIESNYTTANYTDRRGPMSYSAFIGTLQANYEYTIYQIK